MVIFSSCCCCCHFYYYYYYYYYYHYYHYYYYYGDYPDDYSYYLVRVMVERLRFTVTTIRFLGLEPPLDHHQDGDKGRWLYDDGGGGHHNARYGDDGHTLPLIIVLVVCWFYF